MVKLKSKQEYPLYYGGNIPRRGPSIRKESLLCWDNTLVTTNVLNNRYIAAHCRANIIVVEDDVQLQKILKVRSELPG